jgi:uncharacterized protein YcbX
MLDAVDQADTMAARLAAVWRYPVKSLQGEQLSEAHIDADGVRGDRCWGIRDTDTGRILTGRREPRLLLAAARSVDDGQPEITLPNGECLHGAGPQTNGGLSNWLDRPVSLEAAGDSPAGRAEFFADATDDTSPAIEWTMPSGRFVDAMALLVLTTASLRAGSELHSAGDWDTRRFRPNLLIDIDADRWIEDSWCGRVLHVGTVTIVPAQPCVRCTMVTRPQPGLARDLDIYKTLSRHHDGTFGVWTQVQTPGRAHVGDTVVLS